MIRVFQSPRTGGVMVERSADEVPELTGDGWLWIDLAGEAPETIRAIGEDFGLPAALVEETIVSTQLPMAEEHRDFLYVVLNGYMTGRGERLVTTEIDVFVGPDFLISVHDHELPSTDWIAQTVGEGTHVPFTTPVSLLAHLALVVGRRFEPLLDELETQIDALEGLAMKGDPRTITEAHALRRDVILLRRTLVLQRQVCDELTDSTHWVVDEEARLLFDRVSRRHTQIVEELEAARSLLGFVLETHRGAVADQTNEIVRVLTVFSAILLPLTLIAGIWGMNFAGLPGIAQPLGFWVLIGFMALLAVGLWIYFARRGFVGAPRVRDLPKAVGLGLLHIGIAPIRAVTGGIGSTLRHIGLTRNTEDHESH